MRTADEILARLASAVAAWKADVITPKAILSRAEAIDDELDAALAEADAYFGITG